MIRIGVEIALFLWINLGMIVFFTVVSFSVVNRAWLSLGARVGSVIFLAWVLEHLLRAP